MLPFFHRELTVCSTLDRCEAVRAALDQAGLPHWVRARDRASPSPLSLGTRERAGTFGQPSVWTYTIYVRRRDHEAARGLLRGPASGKERMR